MNTADKDLDPEATICPYHLDMKYSLVSLKKNVAKRLFCAECFDGDNSVSNLMSLRKVISLTAINEHKQSKQSASEGGVNPALQSAMEEVSQILEEYKCQSVGLKWSTNIRLQSLFEGNVQNADVLSELRADLISTLKETLAGFSKEHKLTDGPELDSYLETFDTLKDLNHGSDASLEKINEEVKKIVKEVRDQLEASKTEPLATTADLIVPYDSCPNEESRQIVKKAKTRPIIHLLKDENAKKQICSISVSLDGKWIVSVSDTNHCINIWDLQTLSLYHSFDKAHNRRHLGVSYINEISRDSRQIISASQDKSFSVWSIPDKQMIINKKHPKTNNVVRAIFSPDDQLIASAGTTDIKMWRRSDLSPLQSKDWAHGANDIECLAFHPSSQYLLSGGRDGHIICWDLKNKNELSSVFELKAHTSWVCVICFDTKLERFMSTSQDGSIGLWDFTTRTLIHRIDSAHGGCGRAMCLIPNSVPILSSYGDDNLLKVWNLEEYNHPFLLHTFSDMALSITSGCLAVTQNGNCIVTRKAKQEIAILEFNNGEPKSKIAVLEPSNGEPESKLETRTRASKRQKK